MSPFVLAAVALATLIVAAVTAPWASIASNERSHVWWGAVVIASLAWIMQPVEQTGLHVHFLGATVLYLMFGARLALVAVAIASAVAVVAGRDAWSGYLPGLVASAILPVAASQLVLAFARRHLPAHVFIYIFVCGFAGAGLATLVAEVASLAGAGSMRTAHWSTGTLAALVLLLAFAEATLTGMLVSIMVAYRPTWLASFDERRYLASPSRPNRNERDGR